MKRLIITAICLAISAMVIFLDKSGLQARFKEQLLSLPRNPSASIESQQCDGGAFLSAVNVEFASKKVYKNERFFLWDPAYVDSSIVIVITNPLKGPIILQSVEISMSGTDSKTLTSGIKEIRDGIVMPGKSANFRIAWSPKFLELPRNGLQVHLKAFSKYIAPQ